MSNAAFHFAQTVRAYDKQCSRVQRCSAQSDSSVALENWKVVSEQHANLVSAILAQTSLDVCEDT